VYLPRHFEVSDPGWCHDLIRRESFATLITIDREGAPFATHLPVLLDPTRGRLGTLLAHVARPNPQWRQFGRGQALVVFQGPHAYVSPSWYGVHPSVPTWNYVAVHAYGVPVVIEEEARIRALLERLTDTYEAGRPAPWRLDGLADDYLRGMIRGIVAFEIPIDRLEGKAKLSQNRGLADRERVRAALRELGDPLSAGVATLMAGATTDPPRP
jgi:transcriptional regulator